MSNALYQEDQAGWVDFLPAGNGELLAVNATQAEVASYAAKGWKVTALALSPGVRDLWGDDARVLRASAWSLDTSVIQRRFSALAWNQSLSLFAPIPGLLGKVFSLLEASGSAYLLVRNKAFFGNRLQAASRTLDEAPVPQGQDASWVEDGLGWPGWGISQSDEWLDPAQQRYLLEGLSEMQAGDAVFRLPATDAMGVFVRGWRVVLRRKEYLQAEAAPRAPAIVAMPSRPEPAEHEQIRQMLERMDYAPSQILLRNLLNSGRATAQTYNLQGIWHFLQQQPTLAWENFKLAIEKNPSDLDTFYNLVDANKQCHKDAATREILLKFQARHEEIMALLKELPRS